MYENLLVIIIHEIPLNSRINKENIRKKQKNPVIIIIPGVIQDKSDLNQCSNMTSPIMRPHGFCRNYFRNCPKECRNTIKYYSNPFVKAHFCNIIITETEFFPIKGQINKNDTEHTEDSRNRTRKDRMERPSPRTAQTS